MKWGGLAFSVFHLFGGVRHHSWRARVGEGGEEGLQSYPH